MKTGILLLNLGTPNDCTPRAIVRYLREFLLDPRVIDLAWFMRWILVNALIIPSRYRKTTAAYQAVWQQGSPLLFFSMKLKQALAQALGPDYQVELGMRYGKPRIANALAKLTDCKQIKILPLFPQYASAATGSALAYTLNLLAQQWNIPAASYISSFYQQADFIAAYADVIRRQIAAKNIDMLLFSFHGLPERHITKSACSAACDHQHACPKPQQQNYYCYRAQCYATAQLLATALELAPEQYQVCFQSRLGRTAWIKPYTDLVLPELRQANINNIAIVCPSFVADCLETLEEINIRARAQWQALGGNEFHFIPCLNDHPLWVKALVNLCQAGGVNANF